jgi:hypothetical protein
VIAEAARGQVDHFLSRGLWDHYAVRDRDGRLGGR